MKQLTPYLFFSGQCEEALHFYKKCLGGEIIQRQTFSESPMEVPEEHQHKIMHAEFKADDFHIMASDGMPGQQQAAGNNIFLSLFFTDQNEQSRVFNQLSSGGKVLMPLEKTFWGSRFGQFVDKFGIGWMVSCNLEDEKYGY